MSKEDITIPPTEVEIADLVSQCKAIPEFGLTARKLAYQYDLLKTLVKTGRSAQMLMDEENLTMQTMYRDFNIALQKAEKPTSL